MQRREYLAGVVAAGSIAIAGCSSGGGGPKGVIKDYVSATDSGDNEKLDELVHQESPQRPIQDLGEQVSQVDVSVSNIQSSDGDIGYSADEYDTVDEFQAFTADISISGEVLGEEVDQTEEGTFTVAKNSDGDWKIWEAQ